LRAVCFKNTTSTNQLEEILSLEHKDHRGKFVITLEVDGKVIEFEVDSGAAITVMNVTKAKRLFPGTPIHPTTLQLVTYCGRTLRSSGFISVNVRYNSDIKKLNLYFSSHKKPLLGREWIRLNCREFLTCDTQLNSLAVSVQSKLQTLLNKYGKLRSSEFTFIKNVQVRLTLKPNSTPVFMRARPIPFKMLPLVEQELDNLENAGVIKKVTTSKWVTPIIPILKREKIKS